MDDALSHNGQRGVRIPQFIRWFTASLIQSRFHSPFFIGITLKHLDGDNPREGVTRTRRGRQDQSTRGKGIQPQLPETNKLRKRQEGAEKTGPDCTDPRDCNGAGRVIMNRYGGRVLCWGWRGQLTSLVTFSLGLSPRSSRGPMCFPY